MARAIGIAGGGGGKVGVAEQSELKVLRNNSSSVVRIVIGVPPFRRNDLPGITRRVPKTHSDAVVSYRLRICELSFGGHSGSSLNGGRSVVAFLLLARAGRYGRSHSTPLLMAPF